MMSAIDMFDGCSSVFQEDVSTTGIVVLEESFQVGNQPLNEQLSLCKICVQKVQRAYMA